ncbi:hypothetical protein GGR56DRAFT_667130 [Xylariaceae sp. FL0804]|nr:hypothetical protein GGR56DRAFT_667130 [Xylariaceae sp. FL0804]
MDVLLSPQPPFFHHHAHDSNRPSPTRSSTNMSSNRKRKADDDGDEMSLSPHSSPAVSSRPLAPRPSKRARASEIAGRPLTLPRLLETLDVTQLRTVLQTICERQPEIGEEVVKSAPRPSVECALRVLTEYQDKLREAFPYGESSSDYTYYRVKQPLLAFIDALTDFTPQFLPPNEPQPTLSLQYLDGATKFIHSLPDWESQGYRYHKENAYDEISKAWALVINEASKRGAGFTLHSGGWDQTLAKHNQQSRGRLGAAINAMAANVGWVGGSPSSGAPNSSTGPASILDQLMAGNYGSPVRVGPCPGDQHNGIANPFEEAKPRMSEFTAQQIASLQSRLEKQLGPEYLSARSGPSGQKVHYIAAEKCIALANEVFGFNGWSSSIQNIQVDFVDENPQTLKISLGLSVIVRVTLRDGTYHEDIGYGHIENCKGKAAAFEKAKKEGTTDALKRALRSFGNVLGNCIYDKDYLAKVTKIKVGPTKFDENNLHRHGDFVKKEPDAVKVEPRNGLDKRSESAGPNASSNALSLDEEFGDFDMADFGVTEDGHPDEVVLPGSHEQGGNANDKSQSIRPDGYDRNRPTANAMQPPLRAVGQPPRPPQTPNQLPPTRPGASYQARPNQPPPRPPSFANNAAQQAAAAARTKTPPPNGPRAPNPAAANPSNASNNGGAPAAAAAEATPGFFSARAVTVRGDDAGEQETSVVVVDKPAMVFNPHADSPSIRKTPGIDHQSSKPVSRSGTHVAPAKRDSSETPPPPPPPLALPRAGAGAGASGLPHNGNGNGNGPGRPGMMMGGGGNGTGGVHPMNPALGHARQIGAPGGGGSPLGNRGQYKPPTMKRPAPAAAPEGNNSRAPLTEVSANGPAGVGAGAGAGGLDSKRQKMA